MYAIFGEAPAAMELLLKSGARSDAETLSGWTAWMFASETDLRDGYLRLKDR
jgi:ankyrin repeat protein